MTDASSSSQDITITVKGPSELRLSITIAPSKTVADLKAAIADKSDVEKDRQRLIYSGKVLKDEEVISSYKIQSGHTIHMVKGAPKPTEQPAAAAPRLPQQMGTGIQAGNLVDSVENYHHGMAGFNPFQGMGLGNLQDPNAMLGLLDNDEVIRQMSQMMSQPEFVDQMIASNPQLQAMGPQMREMMQSPFFRQMMSNPDTLRSILRMQAAMGPGGPGGAGAGAGGFPGMGGMGGMGGFPGMFGGAGAGAGAGAGTGAGAGAGGANDQFANLFAAAAGGGAGAGAGAGATGTPSDRAAPAAPGAAGAGAGAAGVPPNPFAALLGNPGAGGFNPWGMGMGGMPGVDPSALFGGAAAPRDTRPPEERFATQLGQLNAMGLWDAQKNITALTRTGGNVEAAVELIFSGQLDNA